jgi:hypothetical protein
MYGKTVIFVKEKKKNILGRRIPRGKHNRHYQTVEKKDGRLGKGIRFM